MNLVRTMGKAGCWLGLLAPTAWAIAALYVDLHPAAAACYAVAILAILVTLKGCWRRSGAVLGAFGGVLAVWLAQQPSNDRPWQADVAQTASAELEGDTLTIRNFRNCTYRTETDYTPHWETKSVRLADLRGVDLALNYWGSPWIAHPIVSFCFGDNDYVAFSIETRKEIGETYSAWRGFFHQYELIYVVGDERDLIRVRTNYRTGEDVYLYRLNLTPLQTRERLLEYVARLNELHNRPVWYHALTTNCTTAIRTQHAAEKRAPFDGRIILNGKLDELLYDQGLISRARPFAELKRRAQINEFARSADQAPDFSRRIRADFSEPVAVP